MKSWLSQGTHSLVSQVTQSISQGTLPPCKQALCQIKRKQNASQSTLKNKAYAIHKTDLGQSNLKGCH